MRSYLGVSYQELTELVERSTLSIATLLAPTPQFLASQIECDEEEIEFILSMLAAEEALEVCKDSNQRSFVLAVEVPGAQISELGADSILISSPILFDWIASIFLVSADGEELTYFATQEIPSFLPSWSS